MTPGKWYADFDEQGREISLHLDDSFLALLGYEKQEDFANKGDSWTKNVHRDDRERLQTHIDNIMKPAPQGKDYDIEYRIMTKWGYHWIHDYARILRREDGTVKHFEGVSFDIQYIKDYETHRIHDTLMNEVLGYILSHEDEDPIELLGRFAEKIRSVMGCDQVIYRDLNETRVMVNSPAIEKTWAVPESYCRQCQHFDAHHEMYKDGYTLMNNCQEGWQGIPVYEKCPIKSSLTRIVYCNGKVAGYMAIHYVQKYHRFTEVECQTIEDFVNSFSLILSRYEARKELAKLQEAEKEQHKILANNNQRIMALADKLESLYDVNMETDAYREYVKGEFYQSNVANKLVNQGGFFEDLNQNIAVLIHPEDQEIMHRILTHEYIEKTLAQSDRIEQNYRIFINNTPRWFKIRIVYKGASRKHIIVGCFDAQEEMEAREAEKKAADVKRMLSMVLSLAKYDPIMVVDPKTGEYDWHMSLTDDVTVNTNMSAHGMDFYSDLAKDMATIIHEEDRAEFCETYSRENLMRILETGESQEIDSRWYIQAEGRYKWKYNKLVRMVDETGHAYVVAGVIDNTEEKEKELAYKAQQDEIMEHSTFTNFFLETYVSAYYVNLDTGEYKIFKRTAHLEENYPMASNYYKSICAYINKDVHPEDRAGLLEVAKPEHMREHLKQSLEYTHIFRDISCGELKYYRLQVLRGGEEHHAAFGFVNITEDILEQQKHTKEVEATRKLVDNIAQAYNLAYIINLTKNTFRELRKDDDILGADKVFDTFADAREFFLAEACHPADREMMTREMDYGHIHKRLAGCKSYDVEYRALVNGTTIWHNMNVTSITSDSIAIGFAKRDRDIVKRRLEEKRFEEYLALYVLDLDTAMLKPYKTVDGYDGDEQPAVPFDMAMKTFVDKHEGDAREFFLTLSDIDFIKDKFIDEDRRSIAIKLDSGRWADFVCYVIARHEDGTPSMCTFGYSDSDATSAERNELQKHMREDMEMISGLANEYHALYYVNVKEEYFKIYSIDESRFPEAKHMVNEKNDSHSTFKKFGESPFVHPNDKQVFADLDTPTILSLLSHSKKFTRRFRRKFGDKFLWTEMDFIKYEPIDEPANAIAVGFAERDRAIRQEMEQKEALEKAYAEVSEANLRTALLHQIIKLSKWSYVINEKDEVVSALYDDFAINRLQLKSYDAMHWTELLHPEDRERVVGEFWAAIHDHSGNTPYNTTYRIAVKSERYAWVRTTGRLISHDDGTKELVGMSLDISEQVEEQQKRLLGAVALSPDILTKANVGLWAFELDEGRPPRMYADEAMLRLLGLDHQIPPEEIYHAWYDHIDEQSYDLVNDAVEKMMSGQHAEVQYPWHHPDGHTMIVRCGGINNPTYAKGIRVEGTHQDVSETLHYDEEQNKIMRTMADQQRHLHAFGDMVNAASWLIKIEGNDTVVKVEWSDELRKMFGYTDETDFPNVLESWSENIHPDDKENTMCHFQEHLPRREEETVPDVRFRFRRKTGEYVWYHAFGRMEHVVGENRNFYGIIVDISSEKQIESQQEQLSKALEVANAANDAKSSFLFNMSHDIRTPMNAITGFTAMAKRYADDKEKVRDYLEKIDVSGQQLLLLINEVLEMARIESGKISFEMKPVNIREKFNIMNTMFTEQAQLTGLNFHATLENLEHNRILADDSRMTQITLNIIGNAMKFTPEGGSIDVLLKELSPRREGYATVLFRVSDTGIGMSKEFQKQLFEPFARENTTTVSKIQGTGLGMSIVKTLIDLAGGTIEVVSEPGKGSRFDIVIDFEIDNQSENDIESAEDNRLEYTDFTLRDKRVLLVEDNVLNREIARFILETRGMIVEEAEDGDVAVERIREQAATGDLNHYDFILMDIQMPRMNGYEATKRIREILDPLKCHIPIIALSANAFDEDRRNSLAAGMDGHIAKPIEVEELWQALAKFA